ncbi:hypothetical protein IFR05_016164 [Cadophora sp. M221]|nr:hypothetical protein IFR05_016164 [Cadophora sp. M221]
MACLHTRVDHQPCSKSFGILATFQAACKDNLSEVNTDDFCLKCREFWCGQAISADEGRELAHEFRIVNAYHGPLTLAVKTDGGIDFRIGTNEDQKLRVAGGLVTGHDQERDVTCVSMVNPTWWAVRDESREEQQPTSPRSRRGSASTISTIWPSRVYEVFERGGFGYGVGLEYLTVPAAAHLARHRPIHLDEFKAANSNKSLPRAVEGDGFESQPVLTLPAPVVIAVSHRFSGEQM